MNQDLQSASAPLDFGKASYERLHGSSQTHQCADCHGVLDKSYYTVDGRVTCFTCSDKAATEAPVQDLRGLPLAAVFGAGAAALGTVVYLLVLKFTGYEIGLLAIAVGWLVGKAMMRGSKGRGGRAYQVLAVVLTYHSIVFSYLVVGIWQYLEKGDPETAIEGPVEAGQTARSPSSAEGTEVARNAGTATQGDAVLADSAVAETAVGAAASTSTAPVVPAAEPEEESDLPLPLAVAGIYFAVLFSPFYDGFSNIIGMAIIAFGLWEAFRRTRLHQPEVAGPFEFGAGSENAAALAQE